MLLLECGNLSRLFYKINTFLQKTTTCFGLQADIFFQFWACFLRFLFCFISKSSGFFWLKNFEIIFTHTRMSSKSVSQIFKILFQTGDINSFVLRGVVFSRYGQLKSSFSDDKSISGEI